MDLLKDVASEAIPWFIFVGYIGIVAKLNEHIESSRSFRKYERQRLAESKRRLRYLYYK